MYSNNHIHDQDQRNLALNPYESYIVQAPAGSGKTELLIQRFLTLLSHVNQPESILAITFTKKAASEMKHRIVNALLSAEQDEEPSEEHKRKTWKIARNALANDRKHGWYITENPNQLKIQTIDSFCSYLTRQLPIVSNLHGSSNIETNPNEIYLEAAKEIIAHIDLNYEWSNDIIHLLSVLDNDIEKLVSLIVNLLAKRDQWIPFLSGIINPDVLRNRLTSSIELLIKEHIKHIKKEFTVDQLDELLLIAQYCANYLSSYDPESPITACSGVLSHKDLNDTQLPVWKGLSQLLLTKSFEFRKRLDESIGFQKKSSIKSAAHGQEVETYKQRLLSLISQLSSNDALASKLKDIYLLPGLDHQFSRWETLQSLLTVLKVTIAQLSILFQKNGCIDYIENTQGALLALGEPENPTDLSLILDYQINHVLIDEFQDTSYNQYQLLERIVAGWENNDGRTLFVVGDPMQSIYRFREADVGLFLSMQSNGIGNIKLSPLSLRVNFRSQYNIVEWNNNLYKQLFPKKSDLSTGAVSFTESVAYNPPFIDEKNESISIFSMFNSTLDDEAKVVVNKVSNILEHNPEDTIAIIVRSRSHLTHIIEHLKINNISYNAMDIDPLATRQHIQDCLSLIRALLDKFDRVSWLSVLRSPWCALSLTDLLILATPEKHISLIQQLNNTDITSRLSETAQHNLKHIMPILNDALLQKSRTSFRTWIETTWLLLGGAACLDHDYQLNDMHTLFNLIDELSIETGSLNFKQLSNCLSTLYADHSNQHAKCHLMTIHASKGLEFDTVFIPQLSRKNPSDDKSLLLWLEQPLSNGKIVTLLSPLAGVNEDNDPIYDYIYRQRKIKATLEVDRLLYVATTRAKKRLYLSFSTDNETANQMKIEHSSLLSTLWPALQHHPMRIELHGSNNIDQSQNTHRKIKRFSNEWKNPYSKSSAITGSHHSGKNGFRLANHTQKHIGTVIHGLLENIAMYGICWWNMLSNTDQNNIITNKLITTGIDKASLNRATQNVRTNINNILNDKFGTWILSPHLDHATEYSITIVENQSAVNLVIDRTFIDEDNTRWIIDYKTASPATSDSIEEFIEKEKLKYTKQLEKYVTAFKLIETRSTIAGLYFPQLATWVDVIRDN